MSNWIPQQGKNGEQSHANEKRKKHNEMILV